MAQGIFDLTGWLRSMRDELEDGDMLMLEIPTDVCGVGADVVAIPALVIVQKLAEVFHIDDEWDGEDGFEEDGQLPVPTLDTVHVSPRNGDPAYQEAKAMSAAERAQDLLDRVVHEENVASFPVTHRDAMSEDQRQMEEWAGRLSEDALGKQSTLQVIHLPPLEPETQQSLADMGWVTPLEQRAFLLLTAFRSSVQADERTAVLLSAVRDAVPEATAADLREVVAQDIPLSMASPVIDEETGEDQDAFFLQWVLPDKVLVVILSLS